jgi:hypothetical protein
MAATDAEMSVLEELCAQKERRTHGQIPRQFDRGYLQVTQPQAPFERVKAITRCRAWHCSRDYLYRRLNPSHPQFIPPS